MVVALALLTWGQKSLQNKKDTDTVTCINGDIVADTEANRH